MTTLAGRTRLRIVRTALHQIRQHGYRRYGFSFSMPKLPDCIRLSLAAFVRALTRWIAGRVVNSSGRIRDVQRCVEDVDLMVSVICRLEYRDAVIF